MDGQTGRRKGQFRPQRRGGGRPRCLVRRGGGLNVYVPGSGRLVATLQCGSGHWNSPIVVDGRVALPEGDANHHAQSGVLDIWRLR